MGIQTKELQTTALLQSTTLEIFLQYRSQLSTYKTNTTTNPNTPNLSKYGSRRSFNRQVPLQGQDRGLRHLRRRRRVRREVEDRQEHSPRSGRQLLQGVRQQVCCPSRFCFVCFLLLDSCSKLPLTWCAGPVLSTHLPHHTITAVQESLYFTSLHSTLRCVQLMLDHSLHTLPFVLNCD